MKIGLQTWGTEGDIRPFIALAAGLRRAGHDVTLAVTEIRNKDFSEFSETLNIPIQHIGHIECDDVRFKKIAAEIFRSLNPVKKGLKLLENFFYPAADDMLEAAKKLSLENDLVIGHFFVYPLKIAAKLNKRPIINMFTAPMLPSRHMPYQGFFFGKLLNIVWWKVVDVYISKSWKPEMDKMYLREGLQPEKSLIQDIWCSDFLNIVSISPILFSSPEDWDDRYRICGFLNITQREDNWQMPESLKAFLSNGQAPVYITFGSMMETDPDPREITQLLMNAVLLANVRAIIQSDWDELEDLPGHPLIYRVTRTSHEAVFPYCSAVVHHGGSGTTQAATLAGCPSVVVEHASDQPFWGEILHTAGVAPKMLHRRNITSKKLARAIKTAIRSPEMAKNAKELGDLMKQEDGVQTAVGLIESYMLKNSFESNT
jgi:UDP:flavonoid glycosyltransferase YjiC (YdhE family)